MLVCIVLLLVRTVKFGPAERLGGFQRMVVLTVLIVLGSAFRMGIVFYSFHGYYQTPDWVLFILGYGISDLIIFAGIFVFIGIIWFNSRRVSSKRSILIDDSTMVSEADGMSSEVLDELKTPQIYRV